ncbi:MAG TPA: M15 family metallopeptidase [Terriglobales bacterium]|nr:M15 family metallopeptidase [Terriglobales bacterium]
MDNSQELAPPHGLEQILATFGNIHDYIRTDGTLDTHWQGEFLTPMPLPFPMPLSWDKTRSITQMTCHRRMVRIFAEVFARIREHSLESKIEAFGGCFAFRPQRTGSKLSTHCWGIAIDLNPEKNAQGTAGDMNPALVGIFCDAGFEWGGNWQGEVRDPMHFQFCTGY